MSKPLVLKPFIYDEEVIINNTLDTSNIIQMERDKLVEEIMKKIENKNYNNLSNEISENVDAKSGSGDTKNALIPSRALPKSTDSISLDFDPW